MSRFVLPVAVALTIGFTTVSACGQSTVSAATDNRAAASSPAQQGPPQHHKHSGSHDSARHGFEAWRMWCKHNETCVHRFSWTARGNPNVRHAKWRLWCLNRSSCASEFKWLHWTFALVGPVGAEINNLPEGAYVGTFMEAAAAYGVSPEIMMGIGIVESGGGVAGAAYEGCMNYATFGSWPGQIYCAAEVLSRVGLGGYNAVNPSYASTVMGEADGIGILRS